MSNGWCLAIRLGGIGDNLICSSIFPGLKARYGRLEVITRPPAGVVFENNPYIDKLTMWPEKDDPPDPGFWHNLLRKRMAEYDFGIHLSGTCEGRLAFTEGQAEFGWPDKARRSLAAQSYLGFVHDLCDLPYDFAPAFYPTETETAKARATLDGLRARRDGPMIGWCLSGSRQDKIYPGTIPVIIELLKLGANVCMFGKPDKEYAMACDVQKQVELQIGSIDGLHLMLTAQTDLTPGTAVAKKIESVTPHAQAAAPFSWPIRRTLATLQLCDVVVGPDTGAMWSVAMLPMPKVMLLSHASALNITTGWVNTTTLAADPARVPCWPCHQLHNRWDTCRKHRDLDAAACIADIRIADVVKAVMGGLGRSKKASYSPRIFDVATIDDAKEIILTPEDSTTEHRWATETPFLVDLISQSLALDERSTVLDYGCGIGRLAKELIGRHGCRVVGVDISPSMRDLAVDYVNSDLFSVVTPGALDLLVEQGAKFDAALSVWVLQHCLDVGVDIDRITRSLGPESGLFIVGQSSRAVPTESGWIDDGVDVLALLREKLRPGPHGPLPADHTTESLSRRAYWSMFRPH